MRSRIAVIAALARLMQCGSASPQPVSPEQVNKRQAEDVFSSLLTDLELAVATEAPIGIEAASRTLSNIIAATPTPSTIFVLAENVIDAGLTSQNALDVVNLLSGELTGEDSSTNVNPAPSSLIYPRASYRDPSYSVSELDLRGAIYIPSTFQYGAQGAPQPIILSPGTGSTGYETYSGNYIKLLSNSQIADPVWLNIPQHLNGDIQTNSEYVAYAINYIGSLCNNRKIAIATWSQGGLNAQWALKYWPSTRDKLTDYIAFSPDYHGTIEANFAQTLFPYLPPAYIQQEYTSNFINTLRRDGGDSAYVPTTTIYSGVIDEVVEPQQGTNASAYLNDARNVGVTNNEVQAVCPGQPAGSFYTHGGVLYNPAGFALLKDALAHDGPGQASRIDKSVCGDYLTPGLDLADAFITQDYYVTAAVSLALYNPKVNSEPAIKAYAQ